MQDRTLYDRLKRPDLMLEYLQVKTDPLQFLYDGHGTLNVYAYKGKYKVVEFYITVKSLNDNTGKFDWDCVIGDFNSNEWFRTDKGARAEKYKTFGLMLSAIERVLKSKIYATPKCYEIVFNERIFHKA